MAEYNQCCCESASTNLDSVDENGTEMSLEEGRVNSKERGQLKGKKCVSSNSNTLERRGIIYILKAS